MVCGCLLRCPAGLIPAAGQFLVRARWVVALEVWARQRIESRCGVIRVQQGRVFLRRRPEPAGGECAGRDVAHGVNESANRRGVEERSVAIGEFGHVVWRADDAAIGWVLPDDGSVPRRVASGDGYLHCAVEQTVRALQLFAMARVEFGVGKPVRMVTCAYWLRATIPPGEQCVEESRN